MLSFRSKLVLALVQISAAMLPLNAASAQNRANASMPVSILGQWASVEKTAFRAVLNYCDAHFNTRTRYEQAGDLMGELSTRVKGGNPPDLATLSTPSLIAQYVASNSLTPLTFLQNSTFTKQYSRFWRTLGVVHGKLYAVYIKADQKSLVWYNPKKFAAGHYTIPRTWSDLIATSNRMIKEGKHPWAFGADDGWTLTDFLENIFLQQNGPAVYQKWIDHKISWTSPFLKKAFATLKQIVGNNAMIAGGRSRALRERWDGAAVQMMNDLQAEFFQEATFVEEGLAGDLPKAKAGKDFNTFAFPFIKKWLVTPVEVGPNGVEMFRDTPGARALMKCLVDPNALAQWAKLGGFISPNNATPLSAYPDSVMRRAASALIAAGEHNLVVADASDLMPAALGSNYEFTVLQEWFKDPSSTSSVLRELEREANKDYKH